jgi:CubicO group peptidase (beta-lactamase class C family)
LKNYLFRITLLGTLLSLLAACTNNQQSTIPSRDYWPTTEWHVSAPGGQGMDPSILAGIEPYLKANKPYVNSFLVVRHGYIVYEAYFNGFDSSSLNDVQSVTKSVTSALVGIAQANGGIKNLDMTLADALPDYFQGNQHADKRTVTLRNLLMMRSGIQFDNGSMPGDPDAVKAFLASDLVAYALSQPVAHKPGEAWNYSTLDAQLVSVLFQRSTGKSLNDYASTSLFAPLGIKNFTWGQDKAGYSIGGGFLQLTTRDMAKFGYLYLNNGLWDGKQIIPRSWITLTTTPQGKGLYGDKVQPIEWYGYYWWTWKPDWFKGHPAIAAQGSAGQFIDIFPDLDMVVVITADSAVSHEQATVQEGIGEVITGKVIPAVLNK